MTLDATDKKLLQLLQEDSTKTTKELSTRLNLSVTAVYERVKKLERAGIINKYVALVDRNKVDKGFVVFCHLKLIQHTKEYLTKFEQQVVKLDEVLECFHVSVTMIIYSKSLLQTWKPIGNSWSQSLPLYSI